MTRHLVRLQFQLIGADVGRKSADPGPLNALVFHPGDGWQSQRRARTLGSGRFEVTLPAPGTGSCCLFLASAKPGGGYADLPCLIIREWQDGNIRNLHSGKDRVFGSMGRSSPRRFVRKVVVRPTPTALKGRVAS
jgi:hypothetical protein